MFSFFSFSLMTLVTDKVSWHAGGWPTVSWSIFWKRLSQATVMKGTGPFWLALDFNWQHPGGFRDNQTLKFSFPGQVLAMCCALWRKIRRPPLQTQGSHDYQTRLTCENSSKKENSAQRKGDRGAGCARWVTTVEMPAHRLAVLLTFPPPAECLMLSLEPHRDWISLKSIFLFKILT